MQKRKNSFPLDINAIPQVVDFAEQALANCRLDDRQRRRTLLLTEEVAVYLAQAPEAQGRLQLRVRSLMGQVSIELSAEGAPLPAPPDGLPAADLAAEEDGATLPGDEDLRRMLLKGFDSELHYSRRGGRNTVFITVRTSEQKLLWYTVAAFAGAVVVGLLLNLPGLAGASAALNAWLFTPVKTMFMSALKLVVGPVVFFSIASSMTGLANVSDLGRQGGKVMSLYMLTTAIAVSIGIGLFCVFQPGVAGSLVSAGTYAAGEGSFSLLDTVVNIVPANLISAFLDADMLQIMFLALLLGIAGRSIGEHSRLFADLLEMGSRLFVRVTGLVLSLMPIAAFCSMTALLTTLGFSALRSLLSLSLVFFLGVGLLIVMYMLLVGLLGRRDPLVFLRKFAPTMFMGFLLTSSAAVLPKNMETCVKRLGVSPAIASFSLPLGATVNMDGSSMFLALATLFFARAYGVEITGAMMLPLGLTALLMSIGTPPVAGASLVSLGVMLMQYGVPTEAVAVIMGVDHLLNMFRTAANITGDAAVTLVVARSEGLLDDDIYNSRS